MLSSQWAAKILWNLWRIALFRLLRNAKSEVLVDFIQSDSLRIILVTNKVALQLDLQIIEHYVKNTDNINSLCVEVPQLPQSNSYLKIIGIPYFSYNNSQDCLTSSDVENIIKQNQIFDNVVLASKLQVIKVSPKSDNWYLECSKWEQSQDFD